jgi:hypothetical protein
METESEQVEKEDEEDGIEDAVGDDGLDDEEEGEIDEDW